MPGNNDELVHDLCFGGVLPFGKINILPRNQFAILFCIDEIALSFGSEPRLEQSADLRPPRRFPRSSLEGVTGWQTSTRESHLANVEPRRYSTNMPTMVSISDNVERPLWTAEEFLEWLEPGVHADLIDGEKLMHSPVNFRHANLLNFLDRLLAAYLEAKKLGKLYREVIAVRLSAREVLLPDLCYFTDDQVARLQPTFAPFAPTMVVEALSAWTADRDVGPKFAAYESHGVQEYWVLDPDRLAHRFYRRQGELLVEFAAGAERIDCQTIPGFWVRRAWLNPESLPEVRLCLEAALAASP